MNLMEKIGFKSNDFIAYTAKQIAKTIVSKRLIYDRTEITTAVYSDRSSVFAEANTIQIIINKKNADIHQPDVASDIFCCFFSVFE